MKRANARAKVYIFSPQCIKKFFHARVLESFIFGLALARHRVRILAILITTNTISLKDRLLSLHSVQQLTICMKTLAVFIMHFPDWHSQISPLTAVTHTLHRGGCKASPRWRHFTTAVTPLFRTSIQGRRIRILEDILVTNYWLLAPCKLPLCL